jgi:hypothetical protein
LDGDVSDVAVGCVERNDVEGIDGSLDVHVDVYTGEKYSNGVSSWHKSNLFLPGYLESVDVD